MTALIARSLLLSAACALFAAPALAQDKSLHDVMAKNMKDMQSMQMTGDVDKDFAMMMKHHHQSGIEMAQVQASQGKDPDLKQQAQKSIESQKREIAELDRWMQSKGGAQASGKSGAAQSGSSGKSDSSGHSGQSGHSGHGESK
jgi:spore coat protein CotF